MSEFQRQVDLFNPEEHSAKKVLIVGSGAIGSFTALALAKMGIRNLCVYDDDSVETHNLPNQFFRLHDKEKQKVYALSDTIRSFTGNRIMIFDKKFTEQDEIDAEYVLVTTDNMESRKLVWEKTKNYMLSKVFIDARMGGEFLKLYTIKLDGETYVDNTSFYENNWHNDSHANQIPCTERSIIYNVLIIAGLIANQLKKVMKNEPVKREILFDLKALNFITQE